MTDSAGADDAASATSGSSPQTTIVSASTSRDWAPSAASVLRRWNAAGVRPSGRTTRIACTRPGMTLVSLGGRQPRSGVHSRRAPDRGMGAGSARATLELAALALAQAAPDPEALVVLERVLEAFAADIARGADALG